MPAVRILGTDRIIFLPEHIGDTVLDLSNYPEIDNTIKNEDVPIIGNWSDYSGSGTIGPTEVMLQGIQDVNPETLLGQIEQSEIKRTARGKKSSTHRQRQKLVTIDGKEN